MDTKKHSDAHTYSIVLWIGTVNVTSVLAPMHSTPLRYMRLCNRNMQNNVSMTPNNIDIYIDVVQ